MWQYATYMEYSEEKQMQSTNKNMINKKRMPW